MLDEDVKSDIDRMFIVILIRQGDKFCVARVAV